MIEELFTAYVYPEPYAREDSLNSYRKLWSDSSSLENSTITATEHVKNLEIIHKRTFFLFIIRSSEDGDHHICFVKGSLTSVENIALNKITYKILREMENGTEEISRFELMEIIDDI